MNLTPKQIRQAAGRLVEQLHARAFRRGHSFPAGFEEELKALSGGWREALSARLDPWMRKVLLLPLIVVLAAVPCLWSIVCTTGSYSEGEGISCIDYGFEWPFTGRIQYRTTSKIDPEAYFVNVDYLPEGAELCGEELSCNGHSYAYTGDGWSVWIRQELCDRNGEYSAVDISGTYQRDIVYYNGTSVLQLLYDDRDVSGCWNVLLFKEERCYLMCVSYSWEAEEGEDPAMEEHLEEAYRILDGCSVDKVRDWRIQK